jgi:hypothetical protein
MENKNGLAMIAALAAVLLCATLLLCGTAGAKWQDKASKQATAQAAPHSAPEMEKLKFYVGEWDYTETYGKTAAYPNGGTNTGVYSSKLGPGGNSLINHFHSQGPAGDFEGLLVMTWDPKEKAYKGYAFGDEFPGAVVETGKFDGDTLIYRSEFSMGATKLALRNTTRLVGPGKLVSEEFFSVGGAPEVLFVRVEATRR